MQPEDLLRFLKEHRLAVEASVSTSLIAQAAVVGFAISDESEIIFDTLDSTRKVAKLRQNPRLAFVIDGLLPGECTELERLTEIYYRIYPDGRVRRSWPGLIYVRVRPTWIRYSDYNVDPPQIVEFTADQLVRKT
jgi:Pyridoxamine 5'-phosphate oxidase